MKTKGESEDQGTFLEMGYLPYCSFFAGTTVDYISAFYILFFLFYSSGRE